MLVNGVNQQVKTGGDFSPVPSDKYTVQLIGVSTVEQFNKFKNEQQTMFNFNFVILDEKPMGEDEKESIRGRYLWKRASMSYTPKSWLYKILMPLIGRELTEAELDALDLETLKGAQCSVMVEETAPNAQGAIYNNIISFSKATKKLEAWEMKAEVKQTTASKPLSMEEASQDENPGVKDFVESFK